MRTSTLLLLLFACAGDEELEPVSGDPRCDGLLQEGENGVVDGPWDKDGDGHYDEDSADCREVYAVNRLDCDDEDRSVNADKLEIACNGIDDDCNSDTPDEIDVDGDGVPACEDCDDDSQLRSPLNEEECWDGIDNNCDGQNEEGCPPDYNGTFQLSRNIKHTCAINLVNVDFSQITVIYIPPNLSMFSVGSGQPGTMDGVVEADGSFILRSDVVVPGYCEEHYLLQGQFIDANRFTATFGIDFVGGFVCLGCTGPVLFEEFEGVRILAP